MVSVIIPAYNVEEYISASIESILDQQFEDWELIIINDGSTDSTPEVASSYADRDPRIKIFSKANEGPGAARRDGLRHACGEYVMFLDADDLCSSLYISYLLHLMGKEVDMAIGQLLKFKGKEQLSKKIIKEITKFDKEAEILSGVKAAEMCMYQRGVDNSCCGKLMRRSLFEGLDFNVGELYEDLDIMYRVMMRSRKVAITPAPLYYYRVSRAGSIMNTFNPARLCVLDVTRRMQEFTRQRHPEIEKAAIERRLSANFNMLGLLLAKRRREELTDFEMGKLNECSSYIKEHRHISLLNSKVRLKSRIGALLSYLPYFIFHPLLRMVYR